MSSWMLLTLVGSRRCMEQTVCTWSVRCHEFAQPWAGCSARGRSRRLHDDIADVCSSWRHRNTWPPCWLFWRTDRQTDRQTDIGVPTIHFLALCYQQWSVNKAVNKIINRHVNYSPFSHVEQSTKSATVKYVRCKLRSFLRPYDIQTFCPPLPWILEGGGSKSVKFRLDFRHQSLLTRCSFQIKQISEI